MTEIRCVKCRRLLFRAKGYKGQIEIKCPKCGYTSEIQIDVSNGKYITRKIIPLSYLKNDPKFIEDFQGGANFQNKMAKEARTAS